MFRYRRFLVLLFAAIGMTGCLGLLNPQRYAQHAHTEPIRAWRKSLNEKYKPLFSDKSKIGSELNGWLIEYNDPKTEAERKQKLRNQIIGQLMVLAKAYHESSDDVLLYGRAGINASFDVAGLIMDLLATVSTTEQTKTVYSAVAGTLKGTQKVIDTEFFYQHTTAALLARMREDRVYKELLLRSAMKLPDSEYPLDLAIAEWVDYFHAGTLTDALQAISADAKARELAAEFRVTKLLLKERGVDLETLAIEVRPLDALSQVGGVASLPKIMEGTPSIHLRWSDPYVTNLRGVVILRWEEKDLPKSYVAPRNRKRFDNEQAKDIKNPRFFFEETAQESYADSSVKYNKRYVYRLFPYDLYYEYGRASELKVSTLNLSKFVAKASSDQSKVMLEVEPQPQKDSDRVDIPAGVLFVYTESAKLMWYPNKGMSYGDEAKKPGNLSVGVGFLKWSKQEASEVVLDRELFRNRVVYLWAIPHTADLLYGFPSGPYRLEIDDKGKVKSVEKHEVIEEETVQQAQK